jgi:hypothetical protein
MVDAMMMMVVVGGWLVADADVINGNWGMGSERGINTSSQPFNILVTLSPSDNMQRLTGNFHVPFHPTYQVNGIILILLLGYLSPCSFLYVLCFLSAQAAI